MGREGSEERRGGGERGSRPSKDGARATDAALLYQWPVKLDQWIGCGQMGRRRRGERRHRESVGESVI